jgi:prephenate dehydratase
LKKVGIFFVVMKLKIAIQGFAGSFHQMAALQYWGENITIRPCATFRELISVTESGRDCDGGIMAIENSIAGSILPNYGLLEASGLYICGEVYLAIGQHLLVNPGVLLDDIREVHSHPMAILQCLDFLDQYDWKLVETEDTALSARYISEQGSRHIAGIGSSLAARMFGLECLKQDIHTLPDNYTRFLILSKQPQTGDGTGTNKGSVCFQTDNEPGRLSRILEVIAGYGINLSKLQSAAIAGSQWQYRFHADMEFSEVSVFNKAMEDIVPFTNALRIYGLYKRGLVFNP